MPLRAGSGTVLVAAPFLWRWWCAVQVPAVGVYFREWGDAAPQFPDCPCLAPLSLGIHHYCTLLLSVV
jgi:hypothetical protein